MAVFIVIFSEMCEVLMNRKYTGFTLLMVMLHCSVVASTTKIDESEQDTSSLSEPLKQSDSLELTQSSVDVASLGKTAKTTNSASKELTEGQVKAKGDAENKNKTTTEPLESNDTSAALFKADPFTEVCQARLQFVTAVEKKRQELQLTPDVSMVMSQFLSLQRTKRGTKVVSNVICQQLSGANYSGSQQEWTQFIDQAVTGMKKSSGKKMQLVLVGEKDKLFHQDIDNREYTLYGEFKGSKQVIYNLAVLDKPNNTVYTFSVSGSKRYNDAILEEYQRIIASFSLVPADGA
jgi:hypothetical protein